MRRATIISLVLLWVWLAFTLSTQYYYVESAPGVRSFSATDVKMLPTAYRARVLRWGRELRIDYALLVWFLLPPVLLSPLLRQFWRGRP